MDSVTQATLGAAIGEAVLGPRLGWKAAVWGAAVATLPDLDVVASPFLDTAGKLIWHRGPSHGFLIVALAAPLIGLLLTRVHRGRATWRLWTVLAYLSLITAVLIDLFTVYGTQIFQPISRYPAALNNLAIVDPIFTLPILVGLIVALSLRRRSTGRRIAIFVGLGFGAAYTLGSFGIKAHVNQVAEQNLGEQNISYVRYMSAPTLFNTLLWDINVDIDTGFLAGDYSLLDRDRELEFEFIPKNDSLLRPFEGSRALETLRWFSRGYYSVTDRRGQIQFHDLRFGDLGVDPNDSSYQYIFSWVLHPPDSAGEVKIERVSMVGSNWQTHLANLFNRMLGD